MLLFFQKYSVAFKIILFEKCIINNIIKNIIFHKIKYSKFLFIFILNYTLNSRSNTN